MSNCLTLDKLPEGGYVVSRNIGQDYPLCFLFASTTIDEAIDFIKINMKTDEQCEKKDVKDFNSEWATVA